MIYMRGNRRDFDNWGEEFGLNDWSWDLCLPYFKKLEDMRNEQKRGSGSYGIGGPIAVEDSRHNTEVINGFLEAGKLLGYPEIDQNNGNTKEGMARLQWTISEGHRASSLEYISSRKQNLHIALNSQVLKINFNGRKAESLEIMRGKRIFQVKCSKEIILSAGVIG